MAMQSVISWEQLLIYVLVFLCCYYAVILFFYYRRDLSLLFTSTRSGHSLAPHAAPAVGDPAAAAADTALYNSVHELMQDCKPVFQAADSQQLDKDQVLDALRVRVQQYPQIKGTSFQIAVTNHIAQEMEHRLAMQLTDPEADTLWIKS